MPQAHNTVLYAARDARVSRMLTDPAPTVTAISGVTFAGTTITAVVGSSAGMTVGQAITVAGITGFTTNNPNGAFVIATVPDATHITYVAGTAPTGAYASGGVVSATNPATYAASIGVDAIKTVARTPTFKKDILRGAMQSRDVRSTRTEENFTFTFGGLNLDAEVAMFGGHLLDTGADPFQVTTYDILGDDPLPFFMFEAQCIGVDGIGGDFHLIWWKCIVDAESVGLADETHHIFSAGATATQRLSDKRLVREIVNQTASPIA